MLFTATIAAPRADTMHDLLYHLLANDYALLVAIPLGYIAAWIGTACVLRALRLAWAWLVRRGE